MPGGWHIGVIGGSGLAAGVEIDNAQDIEVASPFGAASGPVTSSFENDVECRLLFFFCSSAGSGASNSNSSSGNFEGLFEELDELREFDDGQFLESFNELFVGELRHGVASFL